MKLCDYIDGADECQFSLEELVSVMNSFSTGYDIYSGKSVKRKLLKHYGNRITVTELPGLRNVVSLKETVHKILHDKWYAEKKTNMQDERKRVVEAAAAIVREDIRAFICDCTVYPSVDSLQNEHGMIVPETLQCFIDGVLHTPPQHRKSRTLIEAIIAATRPRSFISPVLLGIGIYMHRHYASRQLIDLLSSLGISATYKETLRYEYSASVHQEQMPDHTNNESNFVQYVFDNADFNTRTIDGHNTFHCMGGIKCVTPRASRPISIIPRAASNKSTSLTGSFNTIDICRYNKVAKTGLKEFAVKDCSCEEIVVERMSKYIKVDMLWLCGEWLNIKSRLGWSGYMTKATAHRHDFEVSTTEIVPFIHMDPGNMDTIYSALIFPITKLKGAEKNMHSDFRPTLIYQGYRYCWR